MADSVTQLEQQLGATWPTITAARTAAQAKLNDLAANLADIAGPDSAIVIYGSLARRETTSGSDLDWTLLVDGPARPDQMTCVRQIRDALAASGEKRPTPGGAFGSMSFSHELVHRIGGDADTNRITTQRVLLLLESVAVGDRHQHQRLIHDRVIRSVLRSYLDQGGRNKNVPRFLLNDVVRYWRTITVDFAAKAREQGDEKWALRRLKLQTSRKLIFAAGLVMALESAVLNEGPKETDELMESLLTAAGKTPLDLLAEVALRDASVEPHARKLFTAYEEFMTLINDKAKRERLEEMKRTETTDSTFVQAQDIGIRFGDAIEAFFFDGTYAPAIRRYGVF